MLSRIRKLVDIGVITTNGSARAVRDHGVPMARWKASPDEGLIYLVDHDPASLLFLFEELTRGGYRVNASSDSRKALDFIRVRKPEIVLCNLHMPEVDGLELLAEVRRTSPWTRVILLSSCGDWAVYEEVRRRGAFDLVPKPVAGGVLRKVLERIWVRRKDAAGHPEPLNQAPEGFGRKTG